VPDASILPMGAHLGMLRAIEEARDAPVVADIGTGFGNAVNGAYAVPRLAAAGARPSSWRIGPPRRTAACARAGGTVR